MLIHLTAPFTQISKIYKSTLWYEEQPEQTLSSFIKEFHLFLNVRSEAYFINRQLLESTI